MENNEGYESPYDPEKDWLERKKKVEKLSEQQLRTLDKKHKFLVAYQSSGGNVSKACRIAGIRSRRTLYNWFKDDPDFKEAVQSTIRIQRDYMEDVLMMKVAMNHGPSIRYFLRKLHPEFQTKNTCMPPQRPDNPWKRWEKMPWPDDV